MPRKSRPVTLSSQDLALVVAGIAEVAPAVVTEEVETVSVGGLLRLFGGDRSRAAQAIAGTSDKSSRAYLSARRSLERYTTEARERRRPSRERLADLVRLVSRPAFPRRGLGVQMRAAVIYVGHVRTMPASRAQHLTVAELTRARERWDRGDEQGAAAALLDAFVLAYGLVDEPRARGVVGGIEWVTVETSTGAGERA